MLNSVVQEIYKVCNMSEQDLDEILSNVNMNPSTQNGVMKRLKRKFMNWVVWPVTLATAVVAGTNAFLYNQNPDNYIDYAKHVLGDKLKGVFPSWYDDTAYIYPNVPLEKAVLNEMAVPKYVDRRMDYASTYKKLEKDMIRLIAAQESSFKATIRHDFSKACGLMQLLPSTQLELMYKYGEEYGYDRLSQHIEVVDGRKVIKNENTRETVLNICTDAMFSVEMGAEYARENIDKLHRDFPSRYVTYTYVYMYQFLEGTGGQAFIQNLEKTPDRHVVEDYSERVIKGNKPTFYHDGGKGAPRSYAEIYEYYAGKLSTQVIAEDKERFENHYSFWSFLGRAFP